MRYIILLVHVGGYLLNYINLVIEKLTLESVFDITLLIKYYCLQSLFAKVKPAFDAMGKKSFFLNDVGSGAKMKLVVNMIMGRYLFVTTVAFVILLMLNDVTICGILFFEHILQNVRLTLTASIGINWQLCCC